MGFLPVLLGAAACYMNRGAEGSRVLFWIALFGAIGAFWSYGIMHNYATNAARRRDDYKGGFYDLTKFEADSVPDRVALVNMVFSVVCLLALVAAVVRMFIV